MSPLVLFTIITVALVTGPAAFILLWLLQRRRDPVFFRGLAHITLGMSLILVGNTATSVAASLLHVYDPRIHFLILNEVFLGSVYLGAALGRFAHIVVSVPISRGGVRLFWIVTIIFFFLVQWATLFLSGRSYPDVTPGFLVATLYPQVMLTYAAGLVLWHRDALPTGVRSHAPWFLVVMLLLSLVTIGNDVFRYGELLGGEQFPFSPFYFLVGNGACIVYGLRVLRDETPPALPPIPELPSLGLTMREEEILPLLLDGKTNEEIAGTLFISPHTVKNHVTSIFRKAGVTNRLELVRQLNRFQQPS